MSVLYLLLEKSNKICCTISDLLLKITYSTSEEKRNDKNSYFFGRKVLWI